jgi:hypothetical protein
MIFKRGLGLMLILALTIAPVAPLAAAEKAFELKIPGCTA